jgi:hypothetical protein
MARCAHETWLEEAELLSSLEEAEEDAARRQQEDATHTYSEWPLLIDDDSAEG